MEEGWGGGVKELIVKINLIVVGGEYRQAQFNCGGTQPSHKPIKSFKSYGLMKLFN